MGYDVFYEAVDSNGHLSLWTSDGTIAGTFEIGGLGNAGIQDAGSNGFVPNGMVALGDDVVFSASSQSQGTALWESNGTAGGTSVITPTPLALLGTAAFAYSANIGGKILYSGIDPSSGVSALWVTDGTPGGTTEIGGLLNAGVSGVPIAEYGVAVIGAKGLFTARDSSGSSGLWVSDGTTAGTFEIGGLNNAGVVGASH